MRSVQRWLNYDWLVGDLLHAITSCLLRVSCNTSLPIIIAGTCRKTIVNTSAWGITPRNEIEPFLLVLRYSVTSSTWILLTRSYWCLSVLFEVRCELADAQRIVRSAWCIVKTVHTGDGAEPKFYSDWSWTQLWSFAILGLGCSRGVSEADKCSCFAVCSLPGDLHDFKTKHIIWKIYDNLTE